MMRKEGYGEKECVVLGDNKVLFRGFILMELYLKL